MNNPNINVVCLTDDPCPNDYIVSVLENTEYEAKYGSDLNGVAVTADIEFEIVISFEQKDIESVVSTLTNYKKTQKTKKINVYTIVVSSEINKTEKECYFKAGGDALVLAPYGQEEILAQINNYIRYLKSNDQLSSQLQEASNMALMAMENSSDFGLIINFVKEAITAVNFSEFAGHILNTNRLFSKTCLLELKTRNSFEYYGSSEESLEKNKEILLKNKSDKRLIQIGDLIQINHNNLICLVSGLPVDDDSQMGRILDNLAMLCDIADRFAKNLEAEERMHATEDTRKLFLSTLGHELKTPLNSILGFSNALASKNSENPLGARGIDVLKRILDNANQVNAIINTLLEISSIEINSENFTDIDIDRVMLRVNNDCSEIIKSKGLKLVTNIKEGILLLSNENILYNMISHLIDNAIKFTKTGTITIVVDSYSHSVLGESVRFEVSDTGVGIDRVHHQRIFNEIGQLNQEHDREYSGVGLGLYYTNQMSKQLNGEIELDSELGKGSTFTLTLKSNSKEMEVESEDDLDDIFF